MRKSMMGNMNIHTIPINMYIYIYIMFVIFGMPYSIICAFLFAESTSLESGKSGGKCN